MTKFQQHVVDAIKQSEPDATYAKLIDILTIKLNRRKVQVGGALAMSLIALSRTDKIYRINADSLDWQFASKWFVR